MHLGELDMVLTKHYLGEFIERLDVRNVGLQYGIEDVRGVSNDKKLMPTKADISDRDLTKFRVVNPGDFVYNHRTSRHGGKFCITYNAGTKTIICTEDYTVFKIKDSCKEILLDTWLFMFFNRPEFDRFVMNSSWGSSTEFFNWDDVCSIEFELIPTTIQKRYIDVYNSMIFNQQSYEFGLEDLKLVCDVYIEELRRKIPCEKIGKFITQKNEKNTDKSIDFVMGLSTKKEFREAQSRVNRKELGKYKIVNPGDLAFVPTTDTWKVLAFAVNTYAKDLVVSPIYEVFSVDKSILLPEYLAMWLSRMEFDRYARFHSWGSARENFSYDEMSNVSIPIPDIHAQQVIVDIYTVYKGRKEINEKLKTQIKDICPILIKGSIEEARKTKEA